MTLARARSIPGSATFTRNRLIRSSRIDSFEVNPATSSRSVGGGWAGASSGFASGAFAAFVVLFALSLIGAWSPPFPRRGFHRTHEQIKSRGGPARRWAYTPAPRGLPRRLRGATGTRCDRRVELVHLAAARALVSSSGAEVVRTPFADDRVAEELIAQVRPLRGQHTAVDVIAARGTVAIAVPSSPENQRMVLGLPALQLRRAARRGSDGSGSTRLRHPDAPRRREATGSRPRFRSSSERRTSPAPEQSRR